MKEHKVAVITGASTGIGRAVAVRFAREHYHLTLAALEEAELHTLAAELKREYGTDALVCAGDLQEEVFLKQIIDTTAARWGRIDVLVNNAAWRTIETMRSMERATWEQTLRICLTAPAFLSKWAAAVMEEDQTGGTIISISSVMSNRAGGSSPAYIAAKGALESLTYELAVTYGPRGIRVLCVQPGNIDTNMSRDYTNAEGENISARLTDHVTDLTPLGRGGQPEEVANAIFWLSSDQASFITGTTLLVDGGFKHNFNSYSIKKLQFPEEF